MPAQLQLLTLLQPEPGGSGSAWVAAALRTCEVSCPQPHVLVSRMLLVPAWHWLHSPMPRADVVPREHQVVLSDLGREGRVWAGNIHVQSNTVTAACSSSLGGGEAPSSETSSFHLQLLPHERPSPCPEEGLDLFQGPAFGFWDAAARKEDVPSADDSEEQERHLEAKGFLRSGAESKCEPAWGALRKSSETPPGTVPTTTRRKNWVRVKAVSQLTTTQRPEATPRAFRGRISDISSQVMGPQPMA